MDSCQQAMKAEKSLAASALIDQIGHRQGGPCQRMLAYNREKGCSTWLAAMPSMDMRTTLSPVEFRDEARLRLGLPLLNTPSHCDGCTKPWSVCQTLSCPFGGLVTVRHNEARDEIMETYCAAYTPSRVRDEPQINIVRATGG